MSCLPTYKNIRYESLQELKDVLKSEFDSNMSLNSRRINKDINNIFKENPLLEKIGTQEQYENYINSIFPNTKLRGVVYHGTGHPGVISEFQTMKDKIYFSEDMTASQYAAWDETNRFYNDPTTSAKAQVIPAVINLENPTYLDGVSFKETEINLEGDGIIGTNIQDPLGGIETQYVVRNPSQVHILGNQKDVIGFRKYVTQEQGDPLKNSNFEYPEIVKCKL